MTGLESETSPDLSKLRIERSPAGWVSNLGFRLTQYVHDVAECWSRRCSDGKVLEPETSDQAKA